MKLLVPAVLSAATLLASCAATTTASAPDQFTTLHAGPYDAAKQPLMVDCVFDGVLGVQNAAMATHVRQVKRANGYRIDVILESRQFMVADIRDDGTYRLSRTYSAVNLEKETVASRACLARFGRVAEDNPFRPAVYNPYSTAPR